MSAHRTFSEVVGLNARQIRLRSGVTLDQVATTARGYGIKWSTARVVELERGQLPISAPLWITLAQVLGDVTGEAVRLADLLDGDDWIELSGKTAVAAEVLRQAASGEPVDWYHDDLEGGAEEIEGLIGDVVGTLAKLATTAPATTLAEHRAAKRLQITVDELQDLALYLWGEPFDRMVSGSVGPDASPQARGHVTRALIAELRERMPELRARIEADRAADG